MNAINSINLSQLNQQTYYTTIPASDKLEKIARLYAEAFADPPWNEYKVCPNRHYFGREAQVQTICDKCDKELTLAYPEDQTVDYIAKEVGKLNSALILFEDKQGDVCAAGWGFSCTIQEFQSKYQTQAMQEISEKALRDKGDTFFYLSEIMVDKRARNQQIATKIAKLLLERANTLGWNMILRTHNESPMARIANKLSMDLIVKEDSEIEGRVLYLSNP